MGYIFCLCIGAAIGIGIMALMQMADDRNDEKEDMIALLKSQGYEIDEEKSFEE